METIIVKKAIKQRYELIMKDINIKKHMFQGSWNYTIFPKV